jgi:hypothetical protein
MQQLWKRYNGIINNLIKLRDSNRSQGKQSIGIDGFEIPLHHDGLKYFTIIRTQVSLIGTNCP